ncbi:MAG: AsmA-like C-terminal region-containing protein [Chitinophagales bacterium]
MKKFIIGFFVLVFLLVGAVVAIPFLFKDKINDMVKAEINEQIDAEVNYSGFDLSLIRSFPDFTFSLYDLSIAGVDTFATDTLVQAKEISLGLDLMSVINGEQIQINSILLDEPTVLAYMREDSLANWDIFPESEVTDEHEGTQSALDINVEAIQIKNANIYYGDMLSNLYAAVENLNMDAEVQYAGNIATVLSKTTIDSLTVADGETKLLNKTVIDLALDLDADLDQLIFTLRENELGINSLKLNLDGMVAMPGDDIDMDLTFAAEKSSFKELLSMIPAEYLKNFDGLQASGNFSLSGFAKGIYNENSMPAFGIDLAVDNGSVQYPDLPTAVEDINFTASINSPTNSLNGLSIDVPKAHFSIENEPIDLSANVKNVMADPLIDLSAQGKFDLEKVPSFYPLEGVNQIDGDIDLDVAFKGALSQVENEDFENIDFSGKVVIQDLVYDAVDMPMPVQMGILDLNLTPAYASLNNMTAQLGNTDIAATGKVENIIGYLFSEEGELSGNLDLVSQKIDLTEILLEGESPDEVEETASAEESIVRVPDNIRFDATLTADEILYDDIDLKNVNGKINVADEAVNVQNVSANLLGGNANITGNYSTKNTDKPDVAFSYDIDKFDIQETYSYVTTASTMMPAIQYLIGMFSSDMDLTASLNPDLSVDMMSLTGKGRVEIPFATIKEMPTFQKIQEVLKIPAFDNPKLENAWTVLEFNQGRVSVDPFDIKMQDMNMAVEGSNGIDGSMDYIMKLTVPSDKFGGAADIANDFLSNANIPLFDLSVPKNMTFHLNVTGFLTDPNVKIAKVTTDGSEQGIKENIKDELNDVKEEVKDQFDDAKEEIKDEFNDAKEEITEDIEEVKEDIKEDIKDNIKDRFKGWGQ